MAKGQRILIVNHVSDLLYLFEVLLQSVGYRTATVLLPSDVMREVKRFMPDAILVDLINGHSDDLRLLDDLRADPATRSMPVVAMSTAPEMLSQAVASYNVRQVLLKPFNVEDLEAKVRAAIEGSPFLTLLKGPLPPVSPLYNEVAKGLATSSRAMVIRWIQRVGSIEPFASRGLHLSATIDEVPTLLEAVILALQSEDFRAIMAHHPAIKDKVVEHVKLRRSQGIPLDAIVKEHQFLREEIRCEIAGILHGKNVTPEETLEIVTRKDFALDAIVRLTIEAYEELEAAENGAA